MGLFDNKTGLIVGVQNDRSPAWQIARAIMREGGTCGFTHWPDSARDDKQRNKSRVERCLQDFPEQARFLVPLDVCDDSSIRRLMERTEQEFGRIDFLLHAIAFAPLEELKQDTIRTSRAGFHQAMEATTYSFLAICNGAKGILRSAPAYQRGIADESGAAVLTLSYLGAERIVPGYNIMGVCKAALEACVKYAAFDLGLRGVRVNGLSCGALHTLGSSLDPLPMHEVYRQTAPLNRCVTHDEVGRMGALLLSTSTSGLTGETIHFDGGYSKMGTPGRLLGRLHIERNTQ